MATGEETMKEVDVYLFGQILGTHSFLLKDGFLKPDEYSEIKEQYFLPGGETGTAETCVSHGIPYVTIDAAHDSYLHRHAAINVVSGECRSEHYPEEAVEEVMKLMMQEIETMFSNVKEFVLDTPIWNVRTNAFYTKLGYVEVSRDNEFIYYIKKCE
ncbi:hypothetical protein UYO_1262 [Lachnospiraceae bacterium JC7]|nr:hypothetical protein UYO_1262 [Lachnospiraceae bacterium JC7]